MKITKHLNKKESQGSNRSSAEWQNNDQVNSKTIFVHKHRKKRAQKESGGKLHAF